MDGSFSKRILGRHSLGLELEQGSADDLATDTYYGLLPAISNKKTNQILKNLES